MDGSEGDASSSLTLTDATSADDGNSSQTLPGSTCGKKSRSTFEEVSAKRAAALEKLMKMDTSGWTEKKKQNHATSIETLTVKVAADKNKSEQQLKRSKTLASAPLRASPMKEDQTSMEQAWGLKPPNLFWRPTRKPKQNNTRAQTQTTTRRAEKDQ